MLMTIKRIHLGSSLLMRNKIGYRKMDWEDVCTEMLNDDSIWYGKSIPFTSDHGYLYVSEGYGDSMTVSSPINANEIFSMIHYNSKLKISVYQKLYTFLKDMVSRIVIL